MRGGGGLSPFLVGSGLVRGVARIPVYVCPWECATPRSRGGFCRMAGLEGSTPSLSYMICPVLVQCVPTPLANPCLYSNNCLPFHSQTVFSPPTHPPLSRPKQVRFCTGVSANLVWVICPIYLFFSTTKFDNSVFRPNYPQKCMIFLQKSSHNVCHFTHFSLKCTTFWGLSN